MERLSSGPHRECFRTSLSWISFDLCSSYAIATPRWSRLPLACAPYNPLRMLLKHRWFGWYIWWFSFLIVGKTWPQRHTRIRGFPSLWLGDNIFLDSLLRLSAHPRRLRPRTSFLLFVCQFSSFSPYLLAHQKSRPHMSSMLYQIGIFRRIVDGMPRTTQ